MFQASSSKPFWKSKKFWMTIAGAVSDILLWAAGVPVEVTMGVAGLIITYVFSQGIADHGKEKAFMEAQVKAWVASELSKKRSSQE